MVFYNVTKILQLLRQIEFAGDGRHILNVGVNRRIVTPKNNNLIPQSGYLNFFRSPKIVRSQMDPEITDLIILNFDGCSF